MSEPIHGRGDDEGAESVSSQNGEKVAVDMDDDAIQHIHAKTIILLIVRMDLSTSRTAD